MRAADGGGAGGRAAGGGAAVGHIFTQRGQIQVNFPLQLSELLACTEALSSKSTHLLNWAQKSALSEQLKSTGAVWEMSRSCKHWEKAELSIL